MAARSKARKRAVDVLYEADVRSRDRRELLGERIADGNPLAQKFQQVPASDVGLVEDVDGALAGLGACSHGETLS